MAVKKKYWQIVGFAVAIAIIAYFLAHGCSKKASAATVAGVRGAADATFDVVIAGGRVMDPESGLDAIRNVGIRSGKIAEISESALYGKTTFDAKGLVVAPGFIDL